MSKSTLNQDWANLGKYRNDNDRDCGEIENPIVFIGDSITESWSVVDPQFFSENHFINRGIGGQTSPQILLRFRADAINLFPKLIIILAGTNDIAGNTGESTVQMIVDNIKSMCEIAIANKIKIILCSVLPAFHYYWNPKIEPIEKIILLNHIIKEYAAQKNFIYADYYTAMIDENKGLKKEYSHDGVHPNSDGYAIMKPIIQQAIELTLNN